MYHVLDASAQASAPSMHRDEPIEALYSQSTKMRPKARKVIYHLHTVKSNM